MKQVVTMIRVCRRGSKFSCRLRMHHTSMPSSMQIMPMPVHTAARGRRLRKPNTTMRDMVCRLTARPMGDTA